jgi:hypothetical protein
MGHDLRSIESPQQVPCPIVRNSVLMRLMKDHDLRSFEFPLQLTPFRRIDRIMVTHHMDHDLWII